MAGRLGWRGLYASGQLLWGEPELTRGVVDHARCLCVQLSRVGNVEVQLVGESQRHQRDQREAEADQRRDAARVGGAALDVHVGVEEAGAGAALAALLGTVLAALTGRPEQAEVGVIGDNDLGGWRCR